MERMMCLEMNIGKSIKCLRIYDEDRFISIELRNYCKEPRIERACSVMLSCSNSCEKTSLCYLVNWSPSIAKDWKILEEVWTSHLVITQM